MNFAYYQGSSASTMRRATSLAWHAFMWMTPAMLEHHRPSTFGRNFIDGFDLVIVVMGSTAGSSSVDAMRGRILSPRRWSTAWTTTARIFLRFHLERPLTPTERKHISSVIGQINWAARQCRYDLSYVASHCQQLAGRQDPRALFWLNHVVKRAKKSMIVKVVKLNCPLKR